MGSHSQGFSQGISQGILPCGFSQGISQGVSRFGFPNIKFPGFFPGVFPIQSFPQIFFVVYAFEIGVQMVDAMALSNRRAAEVAYKEREAGRSVSKTEKVEGNLFEVSLCSVHFPLMAFLDRHLPSRVQSREKIDHHLLYHPHPP
jgi:hypothetical protein